MERSRSRLTVLDEIRVDQARLVERLDRHTPYSTFDDWHVIGTAGEPAFAGTWVNFDDAITEEKAAFWKDSAGIVHLRGLIKVGSGTIVTLPVGFRSKGTRRFVTVGNGALARVDVEADGDIVLSVGSGTSYLSLDPIIYRAEQ